MSCYAQRSAAGAAKAQSAHHRITDTVPVPAGAAPVVPLFIALMCCAGKSGLLGQIGGEADAPTLVRRHGREFADCREHGANRLVMCGALLLDTRFELIETARELFFRGEKFAQLHEAREGAHDVDA